MKGNFILAAGEHYKMGKKVNLEKGFNMFLGNTSTKDFLLKEKKMATESWLVIQVSFIKANGRTASDMGQGSKKVKMGQSMMENGEREKGMVLEGFIMIKDSNSKVFSKKVWNMGMENSIS